MDIAVTDIDQTITDCLVDASFVEGLIIADSALHEQLLSKKHFVEAVDKLGLNRRGVVTARRVARYADGLSESGGESKARALMIERGWRRRSCKLSCLTRLSRDGRIASTTCGAWKIG